MAALLLALLSLFLVSPPDPPEEVDDEVELSEPELLELDEEELVELLERLSVL